MKKLLVMCVCLLVATASLFASGGKEREPGTKTSAIHGAYQADFYTVKGDSSTEHINLSGISVGLESREMYTEKVGFFGHMGVNFPVVQSSGEIKNRRCIMLKDHRELQLCMEDTEWPKEYIDHDRAIARAIVFDDEGYFYFLRVERDDDFGKGIFIETAGGGVEPGEDLQKAITRELREELGAQVDVLGRIGIVSDYYNLIHRHNINNYYLCRVLSFGERYLTRMEREEIRISTRRMTYEEAVQTYEQCADLRWGRLLRNRELPILHAAKEILDKLK